MDFFDIKEATKAGGVYIYPDFKVVKSKDIMVRGKGFYAIFDEDTGLWSTDEYDVQRMVDSELMEYRAKLAEKTGNPITAKLMATFSTNSWVAYRNWLSKLSDNAHQLDEKITFADTPTKKKDYVSKKLNYSLDDGKPEAYEELISTLYDPEERRKLEWAIGSIFTGDGKDIQKFIVLYGEAGGGKSTLLKIIQKLFEGYYTTFEAKALTSSGNTFSTEVFRTNPLVAIQHDGDLSRIEDNTKLNSIVSHEEMTMNEKYKPSYTARANCFLFMATNKPVKITDAKSGIIRRLIDVRTSGRKIPPTAYQTLMSQIDFELGKIANLCIKRYQAMGKNYYSLYRPLDMMMETDVFFNYVEASMLVFINQNGVSLSQAYEMYKVYCDESLVDFKLPKYKFREELKNYFEEFDTVKRVDGKQVRNYYSGFKKDKFTSSSGAVEESHPTWLLLDSKISLLDSELANQTAQYANESEFPEMKWDNVSTKLSDLNTQELHYLLMPKHHIVIDFDIKVDGEKSLEKNIEAATKWPPTYCEFSKSGAGLHLHYIYSKDPTKLSGVFSDGIEIKTFQGKSSLRRKLTRCNTLPIAEISEGLPLKGTKMLNFDGIKNEKQLRSLIQKNLRKEIHGATKPSIDFIQKILEEANLSKIPYDVRDMRPAVLNFALKSSNNREYCVALVEKMQFFSEKESANKEANSEEPIVFFDVEVFPNLFLLNWKYRGSDSCVHMINPSPEDLDPFLQMKLVGFNNRRYDNHIVYARYIGYSLEELHALSKKIISDDNRNCLFGEAYNLSYADVYDFSSVKQSLKKFQIDLGLHHRELGFSWDEPLPEDKWPQAIEYCDNDVKTLEQIFENRIQDFIAREILAELSGLTVNDTTQNHTAKIIFGENNNPEKEFVYTNLSELFPGYTFENGRSSYRGEDPGEGGYVYAEPGVYTNVCLLDVASMHPTSIELLNLFGPYTRKYSELKSARLAIKHRDYELAKKMLGGILAKYLTTQENSSSLAYALKIVINIVYGLTSAHFPNKFRDSRNVDNIVAKRGALFMIDLKHAIQEMGYRVIHIKTDSVKIPDADNKIIEFVMDFGKKYGYTFENEGTFSKFFLANEAVYIGKMNSKWTATGAQFAHPYVFKTLFSKESVVFSDLCEAKSVQNRMFLDFNEQDPENTHNYQFVGKTGLFCPVKNGSGGGVLYREKDGKYYAVTGTKGWRWLEAETILKLGMEDNINLDYFRKLVDEAKKDLSVYTDPEWFLNAE